MGLILLFIPHNWPYLETEVVQLGVLSSRMVSLTLLCVASCRFSSFSYFWLSVRFFFFHRQRFCLIYLCVASGLQRIWHRVDSEYVY